MANAENAFNCAKNPPELTEFYDKYLEKKQKFQFDKCACTQNDSILSDEYSKLTEEQYYYLNSKKNLLLKEGGSCNPKDDTELLLYDNTKINNINFFHKFDELKENINNKFRELLFLLAIQNDSKVLAKESKGLPNEKAKKRTQIILDSMKKMAVENKLTLNITMDSVNYIRNYLIKQGKIDTDFVIKQVESGQVRNDVDTHIRDLKKDLLTLIDTLIIKRKIIYNCKLRAIEGIMINNSLLNLRNDVHKIILSSLIRQNSDILMFYEQDIPYCTNRHVNFNKYDFFYKLETEEFKFQVPRTMILKTINNLLGDEQKYNLDTLTFIIFTIINTSIDVNNPPIIPYINTAKLRYYYEMEFRHNKKENTKTEIENLKKFIENFDYYIKNYKNYKNREDTKNTQIGKLLQGTFNPANVPNLVKELDKNNASTLIGSLEIIDKFKNIFSDKKIIEIFPDKYACMETNIPLLSVFTKSFGMKDTVYDLTTPGAIKELLDNKKNQSGGKISYKILYRDVRGNIIDILESLSKALRELYCIKEDLNCYVVNLPSHSILNIFSKKYDEQVFIYELKLQFNDMYSHIVKCMNVCKLLKNFKKNI